MFKRSRGFRRCTATIHIEHEAVARAELAKHRCVEPGTVRFSGGHLSFSIDLAMLPDGDGPSVEGVILRAIEAATKP